MDNQMEKLDKILEVIGIVVVFAISVAFIIFFPQVFDGFIIAVSWGVGIFVTGFAAYFLPRTTLCAATNCPDFLDCNLKFKKGFKKSLTHWLRMLVCMYKQTMELTMAKKVIAKTVQKATSVSKGRMDIYVADVEVGEYQNPILLGYLTFDSSKTSFEGYYKPAGEENAVLVGTYNTNSKASHAVFKYWKSLGVGAPAQVTELPTSTRKRLDDERNEFGQCPAAKRTSGQDSHVPSVGNVQNFALHS